MALTTDTRKHLRRFISPQLGSDPELFVTTKGKLIGAEKVIPKEGLKSGYDTQGKSSIELDGVQLELHPSPSHCRALIANDFRLIFTKLREQLKLKGAEASFEPVVKMTKEELASLSKAAQLLGCLPSKNIQDPTATIKSTKTTERSAGGHIHVGLIQPGGYYNQAYNDLLRPEWIEKFIKTFDLFVGLPSVMIDPDPAQKRRRKRYGRASEHRTPSYGFEYRVLSNYWLRSYQLMSFVHGMARSAVNTVLGSNPQFNAAAWDTTKELFSRVDMDKAWEAINKNDYKLASKQWTGVESFIEEFQTDPSGLWSGESLPNFRFFAEMVQTKGMSFWFPDDPIEHWCNIPEGHQFNEDGFAGWETFISKHVSGMKVDNDVDTVLARLRAA